MKIGENGEKPYIFKYEFDKKLMSNIKLLSYIKPQCISLQAHKKWLKWKQSHNTEKELENLELSLIADRNGYWHNYLR